MKDELIVERLRNSLEKHGSEWTEKKMFGGQCFMVDDKMCFFTHKDGLMARLGPEGIEELVKREGVEQMTQKGRKMKGYALIAPFCYEQDENLDFWVGKCLEFNPKAKSSKKKNKK